MSRKEKIKNWCSEHRATIGYVAGVGIGTMIGIQLVNKKIKQCGGLYYIPQAPMKWVIDDIGKAKTDMFGGITTDGCIPEELGELGRIMLQHGAPADCRFTHFIAIAKK